MVTEKAALLNVTANRRAQVHEGHERDPAAEGVQELSLPVACHRHFTAGSKVWCCLQAAGVGFVCVTCAAGARLLRFLFVLSVSACWIENREYELQHVHESQKVLVVCQQHMRGSKYICTYDTNDGSDENMSCMLLGLLCRLV